MPAIPAHEKLRQGDEDEFEGSLGYKVSLRPYGIHSKTQREIKGGGEELREGRKERGKEAEGEEAPQPHGWHCEK